MASLLSANAPLWCCPFRPFFLLTGIHALLAMGWWLGVLSGVLPLPNLPGGIVVWHAHELIFGFATASIAGFLLTALTEFAGASALPSAPLRRLVLLWLGGRVSYLLAGWIGHGPAAACDIGFLALLAAHSLLPLWRTPERRHMSFFYTLAAIILVQLGFYVALALKHDPLPWLRLSIGLLMILIIVALSRISMALFNDVLAHQGGISAEYVARPPRRHLAIFAIGLYSLVAFLWPDQRAAGWLACAAAAAVLNMLNDWHVGRALLQRWVFIPYLMYVCMAVGYAVIGTGMLTSEPWQSAGEHVLLAGALGLAILVVMVIAGRIHAGHPLDGRSWLPIAAILLLLAAWARAGVVLPDPFEQIGLSPITAAATLWMLGWALYAGHSWRMLIAPRPDRRQACDEYQAPQPHDTPHY